MAKHIRNINELARALQPTLLQMTDILAERVYETLNYFLQDYYSGYDPKSYQRTKDFLHSAVKVDAHPYKGGVKASVYIDYESMNNYVNATGFQVATFANQGTHGGLEVEHKPHVWDDTMRETIENGELLRMAIDYLKSHGFSVRS
ncbi:hypothetical protein D7V94_21975 [Parablautia intestinalis]|uniref:HK97 gp10 family phage protein n=1 Tax=Parablautia intestinalis TaxID=2320100 RepID=A0A3A9A5N3_9FIRM|nr:hypothetical protein [Parablautia intestinalis]RKI86952.1 hypothetical protein D7V94_21975 [Parablautia intestinalis]